MKANPEKGRRYINALDTARCNGNWQELPELTRKIAKHAPDRKCLTTPSELYRSRIQWLILVLEYRLDSNCTGRISNRRACRKDRDVDEFPNRSVTRGPPELDTGTLVCNGRRRELPTGHFPGSSMSRLATLVFVGTRARRVPFTERFRDDVQHAISR